MSKYNITDTRQHLNSWALELAKDWATMRNKELEDSRNPIEVAELFHVKSYAWDEGTFVVWEFQDGSGWCITVSANFLTGKVEVEG